MDFNGILNIYKPQKMTSHDVVAILRRITGQKTVGHTGTLDPMATGVLTVCLGRATKMIQYMESDFKFYRTEVALDFETDTLDIWGQETKRITQEVFITEDMVKAALASFKGITKQRPPMYSAIKVKGKKLYEYARAGETVEIPEREVYMDQLELMEFNNSKRTFTFQVRCSKGTYIRSLCRDLGRKLGTYATMTSLERCYSGGCKVEEAISIMELKEMDKEQGCKVIDEKLLPVQWALGHFGEISIDESEEEFKYINGGKVGRNNYSIVTEPKYQKEAFVYDLPKIYKNGYLVTGPSGLLGLGFVDPEKKWLKSEKLLIIPNSR